MSRETAAVRPVEVEGRDRIVVSPAARRLPTARQACTVECASGVRETDVWTGVPIAALVEAADVSGETTHLHVAAADFAAQVPIRAALDGILAFDRRENPGERTLPRLVADDLPGEQLVKRVRRISGVALDPEEDPAVG